MVEIPVESIVSIIYAQVQKIVTTVLVLNVFDDFIELIAAEPGNIVVEKSLNLFFVVYVEERHEIEICAEFQRNNGQFLCYDQ